VRQTLLAACRRRANTNACRSRRRDRAALSRFINERAGEITDHLLKAGSFADSRKLVRYLILAGKSALEAGLRGSAAQLSVGLSYEGALDPREKAELLASLAIGELSLEHWDAAVTSLREVLEIYTGLGDREMIGSSFAELADAFIWVGRFQEATETARGGLAYLGAGVSANRLRLLSALGQASAASAGREQACAALREALEIASKLGDPSLKPGCLAPAQ